MKKFLLIVLSLIMALSVFTAVPAYAEDGDSDEGPGYYSDSNPPDYYYLSLMQGKKAGGLYGFFETARRIAAELDGCEEIEEMCTQMLDKTYSALSIARDARDAICEVELDKQKMNMLEKVGISDCVEILEGLSSSLGDPSATARGIDVIVAIGNAALTDAKTAMENESREIAERVLHELSDGEKRLLQLYYECGGMDIYKKYNMTDDFHERVQAAKEKTQADIENSNKLVDSYISEFNSIIALMNSAYEKLVPIAENAPAKDKTNFDTLLRALHDHEEELKGDFYIEDFKYQQVDMSRFDYMLGSIERDNGDNLIRAREYIVSTVLPKYFVSPNNFTADGTAQPLVTLGTDMKDIDETKIKYALGDMPDTVTDEAIVAEASLPYEEYSSSIPTATTEGTYYVYCKLPGVFYEEVNLAVKVTVNKAEAKPVKPAKKANTLKASGKTVKVKTNKKTVIKKAKAFTIKNPKGTVTFKKIKGNKKITVTKKGKITVKKGLKKGTYKVKVKITAKGNSKYKSAVKTVTVKIKVK